MAPPYRSPFAGTSFEGMEHLLGSVTIQGEDESISRYQPPQSFKEVPKRVVYDVPLRIRDMGLFVEKDVAAGDLIFKIERPLVNVAKDGKESLASVCDNCMATFEQLAPEIKLLSIPNPELSFFACAKCKVYYYCGKACQKAAWKHHHKYECDTLQVLMGIDIKDSSGISAAYHQDFRCLVRLLSVYMNDQISQEEWSEFLAIPNYKAQKMANSDLRKMIENNVQAVEQIIQPKLHHEILIGLVCAMSQNIQRTLVPLLKGAGRSFDSRQDTTITNVGAVFEPMSALLKHSCEPNTWTVFEGKKMRVRALKHIPAGTQLTRSYMRGYRGDYAIRHEHLERIYSTNCKCEACQQGHRGPTGALRDRVSKYPYRNTVDLRSMIQRRAVERAIKDMHTAGFGYDAPEMRALYQYAVLGNIIELDTASALKNSLKIYFLIEPVSVPAVMPSDRTNTLFNILSLLDTHIAGSTKEMKACKPLPEELGRIRASVVVHLKAKIHQEMAKRFGADSIAAKSERHIFEEFIEKAGAMATSMGVAFKYVPLKGSVKERAKFVKAMNELLKWGGLPAMEAKDLI